jgi:hypothetical protein
MKPDRFLMGILVFIGVSMAAALQLHDFARACGYLAEKDNSLGISLVSP